MLFRSSLKKEGGRRPVSPPATHEADEGPFAQEPRTPPVEVVDVPDRLRRPERRPADPAGDVAKPTIRPPAAVFGAADDSPEPSPPAMGPPVRKPARLRAPDPFDPSAFNRDAKPPVPEEEPAAEIESPLESKPESPGGPTVEWSNPAAAEATPAPAGKAPQLSPNNRFRGLFKAPTLPFGSQRKSK